MRFRTPSDQFAIRTHRWWVTNQNNIRTESSHLVFNNHRTKPFGEFYHISDLLDVVEIHNENLLIGMTPEQYLDSIK